MLQGRYIPAGLIGGVAFLLRPDGLLIVLLSVGTAGLRARRRAWQPALAAALVALPWLIYAGLTYGSVIPHSVAAKQLIHPESPLNILAVSVSRLTFGTEMQIACFFAAVGLIVAIRRRSELLLVALWMALYMAGLAAARIALFFPWYLSPLFPGILLFAAFGLDSTAKSLLGKAAAPSMARRAVALGATPLILLTLSGLGLHEVKSWQVLYEAYFGRRIHAYLEIADNLRQRCIPGDVVFVGEAGARAYSMPAQIIVDSSGINSPAVYRARLTDRERLIATGRPFDLAEGSPAWVYDVIKQCHPRYVVTYGAWLHMGTLIRDPQVMSAYHRLPIPGLDDYVVLERTDATK
jgi:hypothetical protein